MVAEVVAPLAATPPEETETSCVAGVQPEATPAHVSRTNAFVPVVPPATRFVAEERNATYRPSALAPALIAGEILSAFPVPPPDAADTRVVEGVQPEATPTQVSATKIFCVDPGTWVLPSVEASTKTP